MWAAKMLIWEELTDRLRYQLRSNATWEGIGTRSTKPLKSYQLFYPQLPNFHTEHVGYAPRIELFAVPVCNDVAGAYLISSGPTALLISINAV